jgi:hypothetical protein
MVVPPFLGDRSFPFSLGLLTGTVVLTLRCIFEVPMIELGLVTILPGVREPFLLHLVIMAIVSPDPLRSRSLSSAEGRAGSAGICCTSCGGLGSCGVGGRIPSWPDSWVGSVGVVIQVWNL